MFRKRDLQPSGGQVFIGKRDINEDVKPLKFLVREQKRGLFLLYDAMDWYMDGVTFLKGIYTWVTSSIC